MRESECLGDWERPYCRNRVTQTKQDNGLWRPYFCADCDAAWLKRSS